MKKKVQGQASLQQRKKPLPRYCLDYYKKVIRHKVLREGKNKLRPLSSNVRLAKPSFAKKLQEGFRKTRKEKLKKKVNN